jgi:hypothetical protein
MKYSLNDLCLFIDTVMPDFLKDWEDGSQNERMWLGKNISEEDERDIVSQGRQPLSIPVMRTKLTNVCGEQRKRRTSFKIEASVDPNDEIKAELAQLQVKAVERRSNFKYLESDLFESGLGIKYGVSKMGVETENYFKRVVVRGVHYKDFVWDRNSIKYDINEDAMWCAEVEKMPRTVLEKIEGINTTDMSIGSTSFEGRETKNYYVYGNGRNSDYDILSVYNFYIKTPRQIHCVLFPDSESLFGDGVIFEKFRTKKEAERKLRELQTDYILAGYKAEGEVVPKTELRLDRYKFCYNKIIDYEETELEFFPYNLFRAIHFEGKFISMMDFLKDPQHVIDRMWMQIDFSIGKSLKNFFVAVKNMIDEPEENFVKKMNITGGIGWVKSLREEAIKEVSGKGANPQWFSVIDMMVGYLEDLMGGKNFQGLDAGANQSGRSVIAQSQEGQKLTIPLFDNLSRWKESVGKNILWWLEHYETAEDVIKVQGGALTPEMIQLLTQNGIYTPSQFQKDGTGWVTVNQEGNELSYLRDAQFELYVTEAALSDTDKQMKLINYENAIQGIPMLMQTPTFISEYLDAMGFRKDQIQKAVSEMTQIQQAAAQTAQEQNARENADVNIKQQKANQNQENIMLNALLKNKELEKKNEVPASK